MTIGVEILKKHDETFVSVVASMNADYNKFYSGHETTLETYGSLTKAVKEAVIMFEDWNGVKPY
jgi:chloramphenicol O-acetyltransferase